MLLGVMAWGKYRIHALGIVARASAGTGTRPAGRSPVEPDARVCRCNVHQSSGNSRLGAVPAENFEQVGRVFKGMFFMLPSFTLPVEYLSLGLILSLPLGYIICLYAKNSWEMTARMTPTLALRDSALLALSILVVMANRTTPFLYFQF